MTVESTQVVAGTDHASSLRERGLKAFGFIYIFASGIALGVNSEIGEKLVEATVIAWLPLLLIRPDRKLDRAEILWIVMAALTAISAWLSFYFHSDLERAKSMAEVYSKYFLPLFYLFILRRINFKLTHLRFFFISIALCSCITAFYELTLYQKFVLHESRGFITHGRPILFGGIALISGWLSILLLAGGSTWVSKMLSILAFTAGVFTALYSQSRIVWVALPVLLLLPSLLSLKTLQQFRTYRLPLIVITIGLALALSQFTGIFAEKIQLIFSNIKSYQSGEPLHLENSAGARLEMWRAAIILFQEHPFWGVGIGDVPFHLKTMADDGVISKTLVDLHFTHMHNEYFHVLTTRGIVGLTILLAMLLWLFLFFRKNLTVSKSHGDSLHSIEILCQSGIALLAACAIYSLTDSYFSSNVGAGFFLLCMTLFIKLLIDVQWKQQDKNTERL